MVGKVKEVCICGFEIDSHRGILTREMIWQAAQSLILMKPDPIPGEKHQCCDNYRRDNLKYLEELSNA